MSVLVPKFADLGFVAENLIFKIGIFQIWLDEQIDLFKWSYPMYSFSKNSEGKLPEQEALIFWFLLQKSLLLFLWYLRNYWSSMSEIYHWGNLVCPWSQYHMFHQNWFHQLGFMILFPRWPFTGLFRTVKLYSLPRVTVSSSGSEIQTTESTIRALSGTSSGIPFGSVAQAITIFPRCPI